MTGKPDLRRFAEGKTVTEVAEAVDADPGTDRKRLDTPGHEKRRGRRKGEHFKLQPEQWIEVLAIVTTQCPEQVGLPQFARWSGPALQALVKKRFDRDLAKQTIHRHMRESGLVQRAAGVDVTQQLSPAKMSMTSKSASGGLAGRLVALYPMRNGTVGSGAEIDRAKNFELLWRSKHARLPAENALENIHAIEHSLMPLATHLMTHLNGRPRLGLEDLRDCRWIGVCLVGMGDTYFGKLGNPARAVYFYQSVKGIFQPLHELARGKHDVSRQMMDFEYAVNDNRLGLALLSLGRRKQGLTAFQRSWRTADYWVRRLRARQDWKDGRLAEEGRRTVEEAIGHGPVHIVDWEREAYIAALRIGEIHMANGTVPTAETWLERAMSITQTALKHTPSTTVTHDVATIWERKGDLHCRLSLNFEKALACYESARDIRTDLAKSMVGIVPDKDHHWRHDHALNLERIGDTCALLKRHNDQIEAYSASMKIASALPDSPEHRALARRLGDKIDGRKVHEANLVVARIVALPIPKAGALGRT